LNRKTWIVLILASFIVGASVVWAVQTYQFPNSATIPEVEYTIYIDGTEWTGGTLIEWDIIYPGNTYYYNLTVQSLVPSNTTVHVTTTSLPSGWNLTWSLNATVISPEQTVWDYLNLSIPSDEVADTYTWYMEIKGEYT